MTTEFQLYNDGIGKVEYIDHMGDDITIVNAARVSINREKEEKKLLTKKDKDLIKFLWENKHTSPFGKCEMTFRFVVPLVVARQHMRHRVWDFSEISRRYTSEDIEFYVPKSFRTQHENNIQAANNDAIDPMINYFNYIVPASVTLQRHVTNSLALYNKFIEAGICREQARLILPQNMYTKYWGKVNLKNLFDFLRLRLDEHAQYEMRQVAQGLFHIASSLYPYSMKMFMDDLETQK